MSSRVSEALRAVGLLALKELRQLRRRPNVIGSSLILPTIVMLGVPIPLAMIFSSRPPAVAGLGMQPSEMLSSILVPILTLIAGLAVPYTSMVHTLIVERERRSLELLLALPVTLLDVALAKVVATLAVSLAILLPLLGIQVAALSIMTSLSVTFWIAQVLLLVSAVACSCSIGLLLAMISVDQRVAINVAGLLVAVVMASASTFLLVGGVPLERLTMVVLALTGLAGLSAGVALHPRSVERFLR